MLHLLINLRDFPNYGNIAFPVMTSVWFGIASNLSIVKSSLNLKIKDLPLFLTLYFSFEFHSMSEYPPKIFSPTLTIIIVLPLWSHFWWKFIASNPSFDAL
jgi:hypothetical protein